MKVLTLYNLHLLQMIKVIRNKSIAMTLGLSKLRRKSKRLTENALKTKRIIMILKIPKTRIYTILKVLRNNF